MGPTQAVSNPDRALESVGELLKTQVQDQSTAAPTQRSEVGAWPEQMFRGHRRSLVYFPGGTVSLKESCTLPASLPPSSGPDFTLLGSLAIEENHRESS